MERLFFCGLIACGRILGCRFPEVGLRLEEGDGIGCMWVLGTILLLSNLCLGFWDR